MGSRVPFEAVVLCEDFFELFQARGHFLWLVTQKLIQVLAYSKAGKFFTHQSQLRGRGFDSFHSQMHGWCAWLRRDIWIRVQMFQMVEFVCKRLNSCANKHNNNTTSHHT